MGSLKNLCRLCADECQADIHSKSLYDSNNVKTEYARKVEKFLNFNFEEKKRPELPTKVCLYCVDFVQDSIKFIGKAKILAKHLADGERNVERLRSKIVDVFDEDDEDLEMEAENVDAAEEEEEDDPLNPMKVCVTESDFGAVTSLKRLIPREPRPQLLQPNSPKKILISSPSKLSPKKPQFTMMKFKIEELSEKKKPSNEEFKCPQPHCLKVFVKKVTYDYHFKHCKKIKIPETPKSDSDRDRGDAKSGEKANQTPQEFKASEDGMFRCDFKDCEKVYKSRKYLVEHYRTHTGERPFSCDNCHQRFFRILDKKKHKLLKVCV